MVHVVRRVEPREITLLLREAIRLIELGDRATEAEREAYRRWKVDVLERIAAHSDREGVERGEAVRFSSLASREAQALRRGLPSAGGEV